MSVLKQLDLTRLLSACWDVQRLWYDALQKLHDDNNYPDEQDFSIDETLLRLNDQWTGSVIYASDLSPGFKQSRQGRPIATLVLIIAVDGFSFSN
ncbi:MAG: hypothetical protein EZS28_051025 [Streblomastix strix]|uniref:Uncharacterized protein n=1 Tax=Streblomastix strix TaxID=222440 RepID=A0A5J4T5L8_9EUKA|nr:MAG: hypothetical protein EZS28_051025 [Streblomastix strix]